MRKLTTTLLLSVMATTSICIADQHDWETFPDCMRNDVNQDEFVTTTDVSTIHNYLNGGLLHCTQVLHADVNRDRVIDEMDALQLRFELTHTGVIPDFYTWGDIDGDGYFGEDDMALLHDYVHGITSSLPSIGYDTGDLSGDGVVNLLDYDIYVACINEQLASPFSSSPY